jgi:hypothetical protein
VLEQGRVPSSAISGLCGLRWRRLGLLVPSPAIRAAAVYGLGGHFGSGEKGFRRAAHPALQRTKSPIVQGACWGVHCVLPGSSPSWLPLAEGGRVGVGPWHRAAHAVPIQDAAGAHDRGGRNAQEWFLNRVPQLAKFMLFVVDRFHLGPVSCAPAGAKRYATHTCAPTLFIDSFSQHGHTITTASEGINSGLKRCAASLQQITSIKRLISHVTTILDTLFERSKYAVYWSEASNPLRDLIRRARG